MLNFLNDYSAGAHSQILDALIKTNMLESDGYGEDEFSSEAREVIKKKIKNSEANIYLISGGTQTNLIAISHILKPYEAVIACNTAHISVHETGAIEATGHKIIQVKGKEYKITPEEIIFECQRHSDHHMVKPRMVYISNSTEMGTVYTKSEIEEIRKVCDEYNLFLFLDGARLSSALAVETNDLKLEDYSKYFDIFYIGGTKCGLLFGEALIVNNKEINKGIEYTIKQKGGLFAKGRLLGVQFLEMFKENLYEDLAKHSNKMAMIIKNSLIKKGFELVVDTYTNQVFVKMNDRQIEKLSQYVKFSIFPPESIEDEEFKIVRFVTSWSTKEDDVNKFVEIIELI